MESSKYVNVQDLNGDYIQIVDKTATQHDGTEHLAINNTRFRRWLTLVALKTTARLYQHCGPCLPISKRLLVKRGRWVHLTEAATMQFLAKNTSIPVPRVYCSFIRKNCAYIVMDRIPGDHLPKNWSNLSEADQASILAQLRRMLQELRSLTLPPGVVGVESCVGGSLRDSRIPKSCPRLGPFKTIQDFHVWLREGFQMKAVEEALNGDKSKRNVHTTDQDWEDLKNMITKQDGPWPLPVFTHGDLNPFNIMVKGNQITGIIDWEFSGWYPDYWEYTSAWYGNLTRQFWQDLVPEFLDPHPEELRMEITRQRWWGEI
ncbi:serine threonine kinase [Diplogelasinospora grovesii]|uniref:Serine threonine kinase n=1 Tax=Diplogelasinospora grovesii TaxID=303347 RepID=A0AAN6S6R8_9PEZI|nr:serine threonine kinase [Diplogelasinospora grovesii]